MNKSKPCLGNCHPECLKEALPTRCREVKVDHKPGAIVDVPRGGVAVAGHGGEARVDTFGLAVSGVRGYSGAPTHFHGVVAVAEKCGLAETGDEGMAWAGEMGTASCNSRSYAYAQKNGFASAGVFGVASTAGGFAKAGNLGIALAFGAEKQWSRAVVSDGGVAIGTPGNYLRAGNNGVLIALPLAAPFQPNVVQAGKGIIKAGQWYLIKEDLSFSEVSHALGLELDSKWKPLSENVSLHDCSTDQTVEIEPRSEKEL